jgi:hypothetical protein
VGGNCWNGTGRFIREDGSEFVGGFREGRPHGQGSVTHPDGRVESGHWKNGAPAGRRVIATPGAVASWRARSAAKAGCLSGDCVNGSGSYRWADGSRYTGGFHESRPHGQGRWEHPDGTRYAGGWSHGTRNGRGQETSSTGAVRAGIWTRGEFQAAGLTSPRAQPAPPRIRWPDLSRSPAPRAAGDGAGDAAVIVGIERYAHVAPVAGASDNATAWYEYLVRSRGLAPARVSLLLDDDATREDLAWAIDEAARQVSPHGTLWFVFVGHGAPARGGDDGLLVGFDAQPKARSVRDRSLRRSELLAGLQASPASRIHVLLDASFSGRDAEGRPLVPGLQPLVVSLGGPSGDPRVALFSAARAEDLAGPLPGIDRPAFSYLALGALRGWADTNRDGEISAGELHGYVERTLAAVLRDRRQRNGFSGAAQASLGRSGGERGPDLSSVRVERAKSRSEAAGPASR